MVPSSSAAAAANVPVKRLFADTDENTFPKMNAPLSACVVHIAQSSDQCADIDVTNLGATLSSDIHAPNLTHVVSSVSLYSSASGAVFVKPSFIAACANNPRSSIDDIESEHRLRPLEGLEIVPSNLSQGVKNTLEELCGTHGAEFVRGLSGTCTHLVTPEPDGKKFVYAHEKKFCKIVTPQWMHDSVRAGRLVDEADYFPSALNITPKKKKPAKSTSQKSTGSSKKKRKTPTRKAKREAPPADEIEVEEEEEDGRDRRPSSASQTKKLSIFRPSSIPNSSDAQTIDPDESTATLPPVIPVPRPRSRESSGSARMRRPRSVPSSLLLDSHVFYLSACPPWNKKAHQPVRAKCFRLASTGGASVLPRITALVNTIVIVSVPVQEDELENIRSAQTRGTKVVGIEWLQHCVENNVIVPTSTFPPPVWDASANSTTNINANDSSSAKLSLNLNLNSSTQQLDAGRSSTFDMFSTGYSFDENKAPNAPPTTYNFHGARVSLGPLALRDPDIVSKVAGAIHAGRGKVLRHDSSGFVVSGVPTHVICPVSLNESETAVINAIKNQNGKVILVTKAWVIACMDEKALLAARACVLFRPIARINMPDFNDVSIALTGFQHPDTDRNRRRSTLMELITLLGGKYTERMSKKTKILVADDSIPISPKVKAARNWEIPVVGHQWLFACAAQGMNVHHSQHPFVVRKPKKKASKNKKGDGKIGKPPVPPSSQGAAAPSEAATQNTTGVPTPESKAGSLSIFKKFASSLQESKDGSNSNSNGNSGDGGNGNGNGNSGENGEDIGMDSETLGMAGALNTHGIEGTARHMRSVSVSLDPHHDWSGSAEVVGSASQSQVIVHRDLTPPPSPVERNRRTRRSMPPREAKAKRIKLGS